MNIGIIVKPNQKGQIVIPKVARDKLGINSNTSLNILIRDNGLYIYPFEGLTLKTKNQDAYLKLLQKTRGSWGKSVEKEEKEKKRGQFELKSSLKNKKAW